ncbi:hypothetical protein FOZ62_016061 [Perkinsus olseni]|uniref:Clathrin/coatomer adaptor adaptin-like N-terminal domain-containing protein n=1 Tax=Perkinsus olseni TaxID=32597 RepID=A0A7J6QCQ7_PEROL|nr:hypothetical protein FOZ62_016061 [Perkinsus olseni]
MSEPGTGSYDSPLVADIKLSILQSLLNASTVDEILSELQTYVRWHHRPGLPAFLAKAMSLIVHIAIRYQSASDRIMAGLVNMLDSTCPSLANEAAVAVREIVEHRKRRGDPSGTKKALAGLSRALECLTTPAARASVVWLLAQTDVVLSLSTTGLCVCAYTVVDTFRLLVKGWTGEEEMVKEQVLVLGMRLWAFHQLNSLRVADRSEPLDARALKSERFPPAISSQLLPRLCTIVSYMLSLAMAEDRTAKPRLCSAARILTAMRDSYAELCKGGWERVTTTTDELDSDIQRLARGYLHAHLPRWLTGSSGGDTLLVESAAPPPTGVDACITTEVYTQSLSFVLGTPMVAFEVMMEFDPDRAADGEGERQEAFDALQRSATRTRSRERERIIEPVARSFSSGDANRQHTTSRVHVPSGISRPAPVVETLADLDLFYSHEPQGGLEEGEAPSCGTSEGYEGVPADTDGLPKPAEPTVDLASLFAPYKEEQAAIRNTGEVVTGEDTESSEGDEDDD